MNPSGDVTLLLKRLGAGEDVREVLFAQIHDELRRLALRSLAHERPEHTLVPAALVNEAYLRLLGQDRVQWESRAHFLAIAAQAMRRVLIDHARARRRRKRGGDWQRVSVVDIAGEAPSQTDALALEAALEALGAEYPRKVQVVELLYFGGLSAREAAMVLDITSRTVERDWQFARAWLLRFLDES